MKKLDPKMKSVAWSLLVGKYQNQMKILVELPDGFKKDFFKNKHAVFCMRQTVCCIMYAACYMILELHYIKFKYMILVRVPWDDHHRNI